MTAFWLYYFKYQFNYHLSGSMIPRILIFPFLAKMVRKLTQFYTIKLSKKIIYSKGF